MLSLGEEVEAGRDRRKCLITALTPFFPVEYPSRSRLGCLTEVIIGELGELMLVFSKMCSVQIDQSGV